MRTDAASAESLEAHDATEKETKKPRHQDAHSEHALAHYTLANKEHLARPANWDSMTRTARKQWKTKQAKHKNSCTSETRDPRPYGHEIRFLFQKNLACIMLTLHSDLHHAHNETNMHKRHLRRYRRFYFFWYFPPPTKGGGVGAPSSGSSENLQQPRQQQQRAPGETR